MKNYFLCFSLIFASLLMAGSPAYTQGTCSTSLTHLNSKLPPDYGSPDLRTVRQAILGENVATAYSAARAQGLTASQVAKMSLDQAAASEVARDNAAACLSQVSTNVQMLRAQIDNGTYAATGSGILDACVQGYVLSQMSAIAMREVAVSMACLSQTMP